MKPSPPYRSVVLSLALLAIPASATASDWSWKLTSYAWMPETTLDVEVNDQQLFSSEIEFKDLLDDLDFALMLHLEGRRGKLGLFADAVYADLGEEPREFSLGPLPITAKADLELFVMDFGGVWYPSEDGGFGIHYGARIIDVDQELDVRGVGPLPTDRRIIDFARTEVDGLLGLRYLSDISDGWSFASAVDYSAGGSEGSWNIWLALGYHFGSDEQHGLRFGYRHLELELEDEDRDAQVETTLTMRGPVLGYTYSW